MTEASLVHKSANPDGPIVAFCVPAYDGGKTLFFESLVSATRDLNAHGFRVQHFFQNGCSIITNAREELLGMFLVSKAEWMVMVDNDIGWSPDLVRRMITFGAPMMIAAVPYRSIDVEKIQTLGSYSDGITFNTPTEGLRERYSPRTGFVRVNSAGTAFIVCRRDAILAMARKYPDLELTINHVTTWALFHQLIEDKTHLGEDGSFFRRWTRMGGEIWCCADAEMTHTGPVTVGGSLARKILREDDPARRWVRGIAAKTPNTGLPTDPKVKPVVITSCSACALETGYKPTRVELKEGETLVDVFTAGLLVGHLLALIEDAKKEDLCTVHKEEAMKLTSAVGLVSEHLEGSAS